MSEHSLPLNDAKQSKTLKNRLGFKIQRIDPQTKRSYSKLPLIRQRKYQSTKNLLISNTCELIHSNDQKQNFYINNLRKKFNKRVNEKSINFSSINDQNKINFSSNKENKLMFQKKEFKIVKCDLKKLRKYSSCNKLLTAPNIPQLQYQTDQSNIGSSNMIQQRKIKSSNQIKLDSIELPKRIKIEHISLKRIIKSQLSQTINHKKVQSENSIQLENEQRQPLKKRSKAYNFESKIKIFVKNPFDKLEKKSIQQVKLQSFENQFKMSQIFQSEMEQSKISLNQQSQIQDLISWIN